METIYYTLAARKIMVDGTAVQKESNNSARQIVCVRKAAQPVSGSGKVIDMAAWKEEREEILWEEVPGEVEDYAAPAHSRKSAFGLELWTCLSVIGAMAVLIARMLMAF